MRKRTIIATAIAGGVVATALIGTPSFAAIAHLADAPSAASVSRTNSPSDESGARSHGPEEGTGKGMGKGMGKGAAQGMGKGAAQGSDNGHGQGSGKGHGQGSGKGSDNDSDKGHGLDDVAGGTLTAEQKTVLTEMAAEEKVAYDLYIAFAEKYDEAVFSKVAQAEAKHQAAVRTLLERYGITDPTVGLDAGEFSTEAAQEMYDSLLTQGSTSLDAALAAARTVEKTDIADLTAATEGVTAPDVLKVYERLLAGSEHHLVAFGG